MSKDEQDRRGQKCLSVPLDELMDIALDEAVAIVQRTKPEATRAQFCRDAIRVAIAKLKGSER